jgi:hypothetical protein
MIVVAFVHLGCNCYCTLPLPLLFCFQSYLLTITTDSKYSDLIWTISNKQNGHKKLWWMKVLKRGNNRKHDEPLEGTKIIPNSALLQDL